MQQYEDLNNEEKTQIRVLALRFFNDHRKHIQILLKTRDSLGRDDAGVPPSGSDMFRPELWKDIHWRWFNNLVTLD